MLGRVWLNGIGQTRFGTFGRLHCNSRIIALTASLLVALGSTAARGDDQVRQVQEELRKRNLYFGDIDGNTTPQLVSALKKYQARKGFAVTGAIDEETAASLRLALNLPAAASRTWPDVPILKSDAARALPPSQQRALEASADVDEQGASPAPPAESPPPTDALAPDRLNALVENYLRDAETQDVAAQVRYYSFPVEYFDHGNVDEGFVTRDTRNYVNRWPERKYMLSSPITSYATGRDGEVKLEFTIAFTVRNRAHTAAGKTRNFWTVRADANELRIAAIREQRVRE